MNIFLIFLFCILPLIMWLSMVTDIYDYTIPNSFSAILMITFYIFAYLHPDFDKTLIIKHTIAGFIVFGVGFILFCLKSLGGGDVKILAASGLWIGLHDLPLYIFFVTFSGGILSVVMYLWRKTKPLPIYNKYRLLKNLYFGLIDDTDTETTIKPHKGVPYAVAIFAGFYWLLPNSFILHSMYPFLQPIL